MLVASFLHELGSTIQPKVASSFFLDKQWALMYSFCYVCVDVYISTVAFWLMLLRIPEFKFTLLFLKQLLSQTALGNFCVPAMDCDIGSQSMLSHLMHISGIASFSTQTSRPYSCKHACCILYCLFQIFGFKQILKLFEASGCSTIKIFHIIWTPKQISVLWKCASYI